MKRKEIKMWMKVVPHAKTPDGRIKGLENSAVWRKAQQIGQPFLYVSMIPLKGEYEECKLSLNYLDHIFCDYFLCKDFTRYANNH